MKRTQHEQMRRSSSNTRTRWLSGDRRDVLFRSWSHVLPTWRWMQSVADAKSRRSSTWVRASRGSLWRRSVTSPSSDIVAHMKDTLTTINIIQAKKSQWRSVSFPGWNCARIAVSKIRDELVETSRDALRHIVRILAKMTSTLTSISNLQRWNCVRLSVLKIRDKSVETLRVRRKRRLHRSVNRGLVTVDQ